MKANHEFISKNIMKYQQKKGLTQKELAQLIGIKPNSLSAIIGNRAKISLETLLKIAVVLEVNVDRLLEGNIDYSGVDLIKSSDDKDMNNELIGNIFSATVEQKEALIEVLDKYIEEVKNT